MKSKKLLTVLLSTMLIFSSTGSVFASENRSTSNNYIKGKQFNKNVSSDKYANTLKDLNIGKAVAAAKVVAASKAADIVKECVPNKDYNLDKDANVGSSIRNAQEKAKEIVIKPVKVAPPKVDISQALKDQIKAEYAEMRATEVTNKVTFVATVNKKNQVVSYIHKVAQGKITYTDAQLTQLDTLSVTFATDIKAVTDATLSIKTAEAAVKASAKNKNFDAVLAELKTEAAARVARGAALTKVSGDLDAFLLVLVDGQAVLPTSVAPVVVPAA